MVSSQAHLTSMMAARVIQARSGGHVQRCHCLPHHGSYNNAEHSWGVAMLMHVLWPEDFQRLALICLAHDVPEGWVGDIPSTTLRILPEFRAVLHEIEGDINDTLGLPREDLLELDDLAKLKACDRLELYIWCREQEAIGNSFANEFLVELDVFFKETPLHPPADLLYLTLSNMEVVPQQAGVMRDIAKKREEAR